MSLAWNNLTISVLNKNSGIKHKYVDLIKESSGCVRPGEILAIMGPSGSGKSTLLNALAGRIPPGSITQGTITYNDSQRRASEWLNIIGFVEQDVLLIDQLTVKEILHYCYKFGLKKQNSTKNKLKSIFLENKTKTVQSDEHANNNEDFEKKEGSSYSSEDEIIEKVIASLNLQKSTNNLAYKLSGGERRRAGIGTILVNEPLILFLDEPTSGLDTLTALKIVKVLKQIAEVQQKTIIITIHQPSLEIFMLFDKLILLSEGNVFYNGEASKVESYFNGLGFSKREFASVPEHIMEKCSIDFKIENPELFNETNGIFRDKIIQKDKKIYKNKNDFYLGMNPSWSDVLYLLKRRFTILSRKKWEFTKNSLGKTIPMIIVLFILFLYFLFIKNSITQIFNNQEKNPFPLGQMKTLTMIILSISIMLQLPSSVAKISEELVLIKSELYNQYYSVSSFYISTIIFELLNEMLINFILLGVFILFFRFCDLFILTLFMMTPIIVVPFGLLVGSITPTKSLIPVFGGAFGMLSSFPPEYIGMFNTLYTKNSDFRYKIFHYLTYLLVFISPLYYTAFYSYSLTNKNSGINEINDDSLKFIGKIAIKPAYFYFLIPFSVLVCIIFGIIAIGIKTKPTIRMMLSKK